MEKTHDDRVIGGGGGGGARANECSERKQYHRDGRKEMGKYTLQWREISLSRVSS